MASAIHQVKQGDRNGGYYPDSDNPKHVQPNEEGTTNISVRAGLGGLWLPSFTGSMIGAHPAN
eukprot:scaffold27326_cov18-Tisochrysis_lutea.AAC.3